LVTGAHDPLLDPYIGAPDDTAAARALDALLTGCAAPLARDIVARRLRNAIDRQQADDLCNDVQLQLLARLSALRARADGGGPSDIANFKGYVAVVAHRACDAAFRRKFPQRARLKSRIRYALGHDARFALAESAVHGWLCGLAAWPRPMEPAGGARLAELAADGGAAAFGGRDAQRLGLVPLLAAMLTWAGRPVELDDLVTAVAGLTGMADGQPTPSGDSGEPDWWERLPDPGPSIALRVESRDYLARLWAEIQTLPVAQRAALLLNLRDDRGGSAIPLLVLTTTARVEEIAAALEMTAAGLRALWPSLPVDDQAIGDRLGVTRQQVINLRKSARLRLARRMRLQEART
jgi:hypothetical protein